MVRIIMSYKPTLAQKERYRHTEIHMRIKRIGSSTLKCSKAFANPKGEGKNSYDLKNSERHILYIYGHKKLNNSKREPE